MSKAQERRKAAEQQIQEHKAKKNKYIIAAVFWFLSSLYIYSNDSGFSDVYSLKPFIYFIVGPVVCLLYTSPSPRDAESSRMPSSA